MREPSGVQRFPSTTVMAGLVIVAMGAFLLPVILGAESLFFRDVLNFHWPAKLEQARAWHAWVLPFVDLWRSGGQPGVGNLNTLPLYPSNLLLLLPGLRGVLWGFNSHLWLHFLVAPLSFYWMARTIGLRREGSWIGAALYGTSGFAVSTLSFYNLVASLVLVPSLIGALVSTVTKVSTATKCGAPATAGTRERRRYSHWVDPVAFGLSWAFLLLAGDPLTAALGIVAAGTAALLLRSQVRRAGLTRAALAVVAGTLIAWPQLLELRQTLEGSVRATLGYSQAGVLRGSWHPAMLIDSVLPFFLGAPNQLFWGARFHGDAQPLFYTFFAGALAWILVLLALLHIRRRRALPLQVGLVWMTAGLFFALGSFNPVVEQLSHWAGASLLRFPVKFWWWVILGLGLVGGYGFDGLLGREGGDAEHSIIRGRCSRARWLCFSVGLLYLAMIVLMASELFADGYQRLVEGANIGDIEAAWVVGDAFPRLLLAAVCGLFVSAAAWLVLGWPRVLRGGGWLFLVIVQIVTQMTVLQPLFPTLPAEDVLAVPKILRGLDASTLIVHGSVGAGFGAPPPNQRGGLEGGAELGEVSVAAVQRAAQRAGYPAAGVAAGLRYQFNSSPEGLDSYLPGLLSQVLARVPDEAKVRLLEATGVTHLVTERAVRSPGLVLERRSDDGGSQLYRYAVVGARSVFAAQRWVEVETNEEAVRAMLDPDFEPRTTVAVARAADNATALDQASADREPDDDGSGLPVLASADQSAVEWVERDRHRLRLRVSSPTPTVVVFDRTFLPRYRATIDGRSAPVTRANLVRLAVRVPAGAHQLCVTFDRSGWGGSLVLSAVGWLLLLLVGLLAVRGRRADLLHHSPQR